MIFVKVENGKVTQMSEECRTGADWQSRWDWETLARAEEIAAGLAELTGSHFLATDAGSGRSPRYDVVRAPKVGDKVSYAFNGDYYPDGEIVSVSSSFKVVTTTSGKRYFRRRQTGAWVYDKTWSMVPGHRTEQNPHL